jgi:hypothetical protein
MKINHFIYTWLDIIKMELKGTSCGGKNSTGLAKESNDRREGPSRLMTSGAAT